MDTTRNVLGLEDETDNSQIARLLSPLIAACRVGEQTLVFLHHHTKAGGEYGRGIAGRHAFLGIVDAALEIGREKTTNRRRLTGQARIVTVPGLLYEKAEDGTLTALGTPEDVGLAETQESAKEVLTEEWQKADGVRESLSDSKPSKEQLLKALGALARSGGAERDLPIAEGSKPGARYRWREPQT